MILLRADGGARIGAGHIMRCLSLADALRDAGEVCRFVLADAAMLHAVTARGYAADVLGADPAAGLAELPVLLPVVEQHRPRFVVADSYALPAPWVAAVQAVCPVVRFDDAGDAANPARLLINYNLAALDLDYKGRAGLFGPRYAPLRAQFAALPPRVVRQKAADALVLTGGADPENLAGALLAALAGHRPKDAAGLHWHFVVGALNPHLPELQAAAVALDSVTLHQNVQEMAALMQRCDVALSAAGSTLYELAATGTPTVTYTLADNQLPGATAFAARGLMVNAGDCRGAAGFAEVLITAVEHLAADAAKRTALAPALQALVDGQGAAQMAAELLKRL